MGTVKRFENRAQLVRHLEETTSLTADEVWQKLEEEV